MTLTCLLLLVIVQKEAEVIPPEEPQEGPESSEESEEEDVRELEGRTVSSKGIEVSRYSLLYSICTLQCWFLFLQDRSGQRRESQKIARRNRC